MQTNTTPIATRPVNFFPPFLAPLLPRLFVAAMAVAGFAGGLSGTGTDAGIPWAAGQD
jgi:hypothetical protein